jgi:hypothetical protein
MGDGYVKALLLAVTTTLAVGCSGTPQPPAHHHRPAPEHRDSPAPALDKITSVEACQQLLGSFARNKGVPDVLTLRVIADHVTAPRMAAEARNAVRDIDHTGIAPLPLALLRDDCARAGVQIPGR